MDLIRDAEQVLYVVADFMRDDVCLREFARRLETLPQIAEER